MNKKITSLVVALCISANIGGFSAHAENINTKDFGATFTVGQHLKKGDHINVGTDFNESKVSYGITTFIDGKRDYDYFYRGGYYLNCDMVVVYTSDNYMCLVAEEDFENAIDVTTLKNGDIIEKNKPIILYDYRTESYDGYFSFGFSDNSGTVDVAYINHETKRVCFRDSKNIGDFNNDGEFTIGDVVLFQRWLLGMDMNGDLWYSKAWYNVDFNRDGVTDIFDLCIMKKALADKQINPHTMTYEEFECFIMNNRGKIFTFDDFANFEYTETDGGYIYPIEDRDYSIFVSGDMESGYIENVCVSYRDKMIPIESIMADLLYLLS